MQEIQPLMQNDDPNNKLLARLPEELHAYIQRPTRPLETVLCESGTFYEFLAMLTFPCYAVCKMMLVQEGQIALTWFGDQPLIYGPGRHYLLECTHSQERILDLVSNPIIKHGSWHIISVKLGSVGIGMDMKTGEPLILTTGTHVINSETFIFSKFTTLTETVTNIGELTLVRVEIGAVGYGYRSDGELQILPPGLHLISPPDRYVGNLSMQIQIVQLPEDVHESKDYVQITVRAAVYYKIRDPKQALIEVGVNIDKQIRDIAIAALQQIIRSSTLVDIAGSSKVSYGKNNESSHQGEVDFYAKIHERFMAELHDHILQEWGIDINNIRIESLRIHDKKLAASIANQAIQVSEMEARHMMLEKETEIITVEENNKAKELQIKTEAEAYATQRNAEAKATSVITAAKAHKQATVLRGEGEKEYANLVKSSGLGAELAMLDIHAKAMKGMKQVCYVPHLPSILSKANPLMDSGITMPREL